MSQQLEIYTYCSMNKQYIKGIKKNGKDILAECNKYCPVVLPFPSSVQGNVFPDGSKRG